MFWWCIPRFSFISVYILVIYAICTFLFLYISILWLHLPNKFHCYWYSDYTHRNVQIYSNLYSNYLLQTVQLFFRSLFRLNPPNFLSRYIIRYSTSWSAPNFSFTVRITSVKLYSSLPIYILSTHAKQFYTLYILHILIICSKLYIFIPI